MGRIYICHARSLTTNASLRDDDEPVVDCDIDANFFHICSCSSTSLSLYCLLALVCSVSEQFLFIFLGTLAYLSFCELQYIPTLVKVNLLYKANVPWELAYIKSVHRGPLTSLRTIGPSGPLRISFSSPSLPSLRVSHFSPYVLR